MKEKESHGITYYKRKLNMVGIFFKHYSHQKEKKLL